MSETSRSGIDRWMISFAWIFGAVVFLYFGIFAALVVDGPVLKTNVIENSIRSVSPELHSSVGDVLQVVYSPLIWLAEKGGLF